MVAWRQWVGAWYLPRVHSTQVLWAEARREQGRQGAMCWAAYAVTPKRPTFTDLLNDLK
jgi:hypothetical protein